MMKLMQEIDQNLLQRMVSSIHERPFLSREDFHEVIKTLINLTSETAKFLKDVEMEINSKWAPRYESPKYHYTRLLKKLDQ